MPKSLLPRRGVEVKIAAMKPGRVTAMTFCVLLEGLLATPTGSAPFVRP